MESEEGLINVEGIKMVIESLRSLLFCEKMKRLLPHCLPLKERMKDRTISYIGLYCLDPFLRKLN